MTVQESSGSKSSKALKIIRTGGYPVNSSKAATIHGKSRLVHNHMRDAH